MIKDEFFDLKRNVLLSIRLNDFIVLEKHKKD
jgi:hypothetical protein